jgi:hypothetical protein
MVVNPRCMREGYGSRSVRVSDTALPANTSFGSLKCDVLRFLVAFRLYELCGFSWKRFDQEFWRHLLVTASFFAFDGQKRQYWLLFNSKGIYGSKKTTGSSAHWQISFLALCANCWYGTSMHCGMAPWYFSILRNHVQYARGCAFLRLQNIIDVLAVLK